MLRAEIEWEKNDHGQIKYPILSSPPVCFDEIGINPNGTSQKDWSKIASIVLGHDSKVPLQKMLLKAKQEFQIHQEM